MAIDLSVIVRAAIDALAARLDFCFGLVNLLFDSSSSLTIARLLRLLLLSFSSRARLRHVHYCSIESLRFIASITLILLRCIYSRERERKTREDNHYIFISSSFLCPRSLCAKEKYRRQLLLGRCFIHSIIHSHIAVKPIYLPGVLRARTQRNTERERETPREVIPSIVEIDRKLHVGGAFSLLGRRDVFISEKDVSGA